MSLIQQSRGAEQPSAWAIGLFAFSVAAVLGAFALIALVP
jgi:hypothetical protein